MDTEDFGILIVDDEPAIRDSLQSWFESFGYRTEKAADAGEAMSKLSRGSWNIVLLDIKMPGISGIELQKRIRQSDPNIIIIMITAHASVDTAVESLKEGAFDYVSKPIDPDELSLIVRRATEQLKLRRNDAQPDGDIGELVLKDCMIGESPQMQKVFELIKAAANTDVTVLIHGDRGTGKELVARMIHANSSRKFFPLIPVSCGSLGDSLLESELFGHDKGTFIGAQYMRKGKLEMANGGTLFLDEIGAISKENQDALLQVFKERSFTRSGGNQIIPADFRIICATNQDLDQLVKDALFKEDFYYHVSVFQIDIPPLSERRSDIPMLTEYFADKYSHALGKKIPKISKAAMEAMMEYNWPGNVRELENAVERTIVVATKPQIELEDLPRQMKSKGADSQEDSLEIIEKRHISDVLEKTSWNISKAAKKLGVDRATLYNKIKKYKLNKHQ
jgi:DNA-binding NtrC family response regulator